jgi:hypothetical protein
MGSDDYIARLPWLLVHGELIWEMILLVFAAAGLRYGLRWRTRMILGAAGGATLGVASMWVVGVMAAPRRSLETAAL